MNRRFKRNLVLRLCFVLSSAMLFVSGNAAGSVLTSEEASGTQILLGGAPIRHASAAVADFNGDGYLEIVVGTLDGMLHVISFNGTTWSSVWSRQTADDINAAGPPNPVPTNRIESAPGIADLDNDGSLEIVVTTGSLPMYGYNGGLLVYEYQSAWNFAVASNWPQPKLDVVGGGAGAGDPDGYWDGIYGSPALGDLDGDGDLEIVFQGEDRRIHAYHHNGTVVAGWPFFRDNGDPILRGGIGSPALGDLDGDGIPEIVVGGLSPEWEGDTGGISPDYTKAAVWALHGDSTMVAGWPQYAEDWVDSSPALGDIDGDGEFEIVVGTGRDGINPGDTGGHYVYAWNVDGSTVTGWPRPTGANMASSPALADLDGDNVLDVIIGCGAEEISECHYLYAWHGDGTNVPGFPMEPLDVNPWGHVPQRLPFPPVVADIDGDAHQEILLVMANSNGVSVVNHDGTMSTDYSRIQDDFSGMIAPPLVADVDGDGFLETVGTGAGVGEQAAVYIWDEVAPVTAARPWPMFHRDSHRSGYSPMDEVPPTNPTSLNSTPNANVWTNDNTVEVTWSGASDEGSGVARYYYVWDTIADTLPTHSDAFVAEPVNNLTSVALHDGTTWYFHLRTADKAGNLAEDALHLGPFKIDTQAPDSQASSPDEIIGSIPVSWGGTDGGSGIASYTIQVRAGTAGVWQDWLTDVPSNMLFDDYAAISCGITYYFRSQATDIAGNQEVVPAAGDSSTLSITDYVLHGLVTNNVAEPVWGAQAVSVDSCAAATSDADGRFALYYLQAGDYDVTASHANFGTLETIYALSTTLQMTTTFVLPPVNDVVQNGQFETGDLTGWASVGAVQVTMRPHSGQHSVAFSGNGALSQTVTMPETGVLSWLYRVSQDVPSATFQVTSASLLVSSVQSGSVISMVMPSQVLPWSHYWLDLEAFAGQQVTLEVQVQATGADGAANFDEITLGTTVPGKASVFLPVVVRQ